MNTSTRVSIWLASLTVFLITLAASAAWLPEHYPEPCRFMFQQSFLVATIASVFVTGLNLLIVRANLPKEPSLVSTPVLILSGIFLASMLFWVIRLIRFFGKTGAA